jgi:membrane protein implicated in regulation of membrane protease activity
MSPAFFFWVVLAVIFVAAELHSIAFFAVFGAAGSAAAAIVALFAEEAYALQIAVAIGVAVLGVLLVRPYVSKVFESHGPGDRIAGVHGGLIAARGVTLDIVGSDVAPTGHVRILGETWLAVTAIGTPIPPQTPVVVIAVTGTTLTVRPQIDGETAKAEQP